MVFNYYNFNCVLVDYFSFDFKTIKLYSFLIKLYFKFLLKLILNAPIKLLQKKEKNIIFRERRTFLILIQTIKEFYNKNLYIFNHFMIYKKYIKKIIT